MRDSLSIRVDSSLAPVAFLACARVASSANLSDSNEQTAIHQHGRNSKKYEGAQRGAEKKKATTGETKNGPCTLDVLTSLHRRLDRRVERRAPRLQKVFAANARREGREDDGQVSTMWCVPPSSSMFRAPLNRSFAVRGLGIFI